MSSCGEGLHSSIICLYKLYIISPVPSEKVGELKKETFMKTEKKKPISIVTYKAIEPRLYRHLVRRKPVFSFAGSKYAANLEEKSFNIGIKIFLNS